MIQPLIARDNDGVEVCGSCIGFAADYTRKQRGRAGTLLQPRPTLSLCPRRAINTLLAGPDGTITPQLEPFAAAPADAPSPFPAIQCLKESPNIKLLTQLVTEGHTLSHTLPDKLPPSRNQRYIRQPLLHTGILTEHDEDLERIPGRPEHELANKPAATAGLARPFLHWLLLRHAALNAFIGKLPLASRSASLAEQVPQLLPGDVLTGASQRAATSASLDSGPGAPSAARSARRHRPRQASATEQAVHANTCRSKDGTHTRLRAQPHAPRNVTACTVPATRTARATIPAEAHG
ncbi:hypothetical protein [Streptomyces griseus]|uniref:hypothetical protein n=1 Tax=Streptomyces griseus TaxID=1911 RepID=UPI001112D62A|nr:hypothetical protein [Streptomyces griseus]